MARYTGAVKWFSGAKGYGFLGHQDGPDVFVHFSSVILDGYKCLREGEPVEFEIIQGEKGPQAHRVLPLNRVTTTSQPQNNHPSRSPD